MLRKVGRPTVSALTRFWSHVECSETCWRWSGHLNNQGYGQFAVNSAYRMYAHRFSWEVHNAREIPAGLQVDHLCNNRACVNPSHLEVVTASENTVRSFARRRAGCGTTALSRD